MHFFLEGRLPFLRVGESRSFIIRLMHCNCSSSRRNASESHHPHDKLGSLCSAAPAAISLFPSRDRIRLFHKKLSVHCRSEKKGETFCLLCSRPTGHHGSKASSPVQTRLNTAVQQHNNRTDELGPQRRDRLERGSFKDRIELRTESQRSLISGCHAFTKPFRTPRNVMTCRRCRVSFSAVEGDGRRRTRLRDRSYALELFESLID